MKIGNILTGLMFTGVCLAVTGSLASAAVLSDDFNDSVVGSLAGQAADTGQAWGAFGLFGSYGSLAIDAAHGYSGTQGAGSTSAAFFGNTVLFGQTLTSGLIQIDMDVSTSVTGTSTHHQWWLSNADGTVNASLQWLGSGFIGFEGMGFSDPGSASGMSGGTLHQTVLIDLDAKTVSYSWFDADDPGDLTTSGSVSLGTYGDAYVPDRLHLWQMTATSVNGGYDNINIAIPEPASLALMGLGGLLVGARRRK